MNKTLNHIISRVTSYMPPSLPARLYNTLLSLPILRTITNAMIRLMIPEYLTIEEGKIALNKSDVGVSGSLALGIYEKFEIDLLRKNLNKGMNVLDIGANIGLYSVITAKRIGNGKVYAFEPEKDNFLMLNKNIKLNDLHNVIPLNKAASNKIGKSNLFMTKDNNGTHSLADNRNTQITTAIETDTIDNVLQKYNYPKIDLIKMDIEGAEFLAIEGMKDTLARNKKMIIFTELYPNAMRRLNCEPIRYLITLKDLGFSLFWIDEDSDRLIPLHDFEYFIKQFPKFESSKNIYCVRQTEKSTNSVDFP